MCQRIDFCDDAAKQERHRGDLAMSFHNGTDRRHVLVLEIEEIDSRQTLLMHRRILLQLLHAKQISGRIEALFQC